MNDLNYNTFSANADESETLTTIEDQTDCDIRFLILRHLLYWISMPVSILFTIFFVTMDYHISEILLVSASVQSVVTIIQIRLLYHNYESQMNIDIIEDYGSICTTSFIWFVINVVASSLKIKIVKWYVLSMVYMPALIWLVMMLSIGSYKLYYYIKTKIEIEIQTRKNILLEKNAQINTETNDFDDLDKIKIDDGESDVGDKN